MRATETEGYGDYRNLTILSEPDPDDLNLQQLDIEKILQETNATLKKLDNHFKLA